MVYNLMFVLPMIWLDFIAPHTGLAIASSLAAWQQAFMLYRQLSADNIYHLSPDLVRFAIRGLPALIALMVTLVAFNGVDWQIRDALGRVSQLVGIIIAGTATYIVGLLITGIRPKHLASP